MIDEYCDKTCKYYGNATLSTGWNPFLCQNKNKPNRTIAWVNCTYRKPRILHRIKRMIWRANDKN